MPSEDRQLKDWLDSWIEFTKNTEPPHLFKLWVGLSTMAACLKRKCLFRLGSETFYPNMYVVLTGPSGTRKNTAIAPGKDFLSAVGVEIAANSTTRQQLIRALRKASDTIVDPETGAMDIHSSMNIFNSELTVFLGYKNLELITDLIDWYDCEDPWRYETKHDMGGGNIDNIRGVWVNILGGTTPDLIRASMPSEAIGFGLTGRIVFVYEQRRGSTIMIPTYKEIIRDAMIHDLYTISMMKGEFKATTAFMDRWVEWRLECDNNPPFDDQNFRPYIERRPAHAMKVSMLCSASRSDDMVMDVQDLNRAIDILKQTEIKMRYTFSGVGRSSFSAIISQVMAEIGVKKETTFEALLNRFYMDVDKWGMEKVIETLEAMKFVQVIVKGNDKTIRLVEE
jgi:hypothetical protein